MDSLHGSIEMMLKQILDKQLEHEKSGQYVEAEECRLNYQKQKQNYHNKTMSEMNMRHKRSEEDLMRAKKNQLESFNGFWDKQISDFTQQSEKMKQDLQKKHNDEQKKTKEDLQKSLPDKVKESSQLLNLRKMEEHMAKQKNYPQAHQIQEKIAAYLKKQTQTWDLNKKTKIESALNTLRNKQKTQMTNFEKRVATSKAEKNLQRRKEEEKINLKYDNFLKDLKNSNEKEILAFKGEFTSLGGSGTASSSPAKSRSSFGSSR